jgi:predicted  nucleic acid-binding Zn-ribbon protein
LYEVDLRKTVKLIKQKIDTQVSGTQVLLHRVIEKQILADFRNAEKQINDYIQRFQDELDNLLREREKKEAEADRIRETLEDQKAALNEYLSELIFIRESLDSWKPRQTVK